MQEAMILTEKADQQMVNTKLFGGHGELLVEYV